MVAAAAPSMSTAVAGGAFGCLIALFCVIAFGCLGFTETNVPMVVRVVVIVVGSLLALAAVVAVTLLFHHAAWVDFRRDL